MDTPIPPMVPTPPPRNPQLLRSASLWTLAALAWSTVTGLVVLNNPMILRWLLLKGHARYAVIAAILLMLFWPGVRKYVGERGARAYLALVSTSFGVFGAVLVFALKLVPLLTVLALASFSLGAMVLFGLLAPVNLRKPRQVLEVLRQVAELTLAGVTLGPELGWVETAIVVLGLVAALVIVGDDAQAAGDESRVVPVEEIQKVATMRAVDLYLSFFRLTLIYTQLLRRQKRRPR